MEIMGSKTSAVARPLKAGAPVVPGTTEALQDFKAARSRPPLSWVIREC
jgi:acetyl/propionyl-CoA carboxylase alpha subunit